MNKGFNNSWGMFFSYEFWYFISMNWVIILFIFTLNQFLIKCCNINKYLHGNMKVMYAYYIVLSAIKLHKISWDYEIIY